MANFVAHKKLETILKLLIDEEKAGELSDSLMQNEEEIREARELLIDVSLTITCINSSNIFMKMVHSGSSDLITKIILSNG